MINVITKAYIFPIFSACLLLVIACDSKTTKPENISCMHQETNYKEMDITDKKEETESEDMFVLEIFKDLEGAWQIQREIEDYGNMEGTASFQKMKNDSNLYSYHYQEKGTLQLTAGNQFPVHKEYIYAYKGGEISIHFWNDRREQQGELLHTLSFSQPLEKSWPFHAYGTHICSQDTYKAHYEFMDNNNFKLTYHICGPHKNHAIQTIFSRAIKRIK